MEVYVVSKICDWKYFCTEVVFVMTDEQVANNRLCDKRKLLQGSWYSKKNLFLGDNEQCHNN